jgi:hypothetical protein
MRDGRQVVCRRGAWPVGGGRALLTVASEGGNEGEAENDDEERKQGEADRFHGQASEQL